MREPEHAARTGVPRPLVIAVTGHRDLVEDEIPALRDKVGALLRSLAADYPDRRLQVMSALAEGAEHLTEQPLAGGQNGQTPGGERILNPEDGYYRLTFNGAGAGITDAAGNAFAALAGLPRPSASAAHDRASGITRLAHPAGSLSVPLVDLPVGAAVRVRIRATGQKWPPAPITIGALIVPIWTLAELGNRHDDPLRGREQLYAEPDQIGGAGVYGGAKSGHK